MNRTSEPLPLWLNQFFQISTISGEDSNSKKSLPKLAVRTNDVTSDRQASFVSAALTGLKAPVMADHEDN